MENLEEILKKELEKNSYNIEDMDENTKEIFKEFQSSFIKNMTSSDENIDKNILENLNNLDCFINNFKNLNVDELTKIGVYILKNNIQFKNSIMLYNFIATIIGYKNQ